MRSSAPLLAGIPRWFAVGFTCLSVVLFVLVALLWGARGATLAALVAALIAITQTVRGFGPFIGSDELFDDAVLNAQGYAVALSMAGLLLATVVERRRLARCNRQADDSPARRPARISSPDPRRAS